MSRKYTLKRRAEKQAETRDRIVEAVVELHEEIGPAQTTISAIAERAGVQRLTVYRHFPDEAALFIACRDHWLALHPMPNLAALRSIDDPHERLRRGLYEMYTYYEGTEQMIGNVVRDATVSDTVAGAMQPILEQLGSIHAAMVDGWNVTDDQQALLNAVVAHAIDFSTWHSLVRRQGLDADHVASLMTCLAECAIASSDRLA